MNKIFHQCIGFSTYRQCYHHHTLLNNHHLNHENPGSEDTFIVDSNAVSNLVLQPDMFVALHSLILRKWRSRPDATGAYMDSFGSQPCFVDGQFLPP